jgi:hypothetical protein
MARITRNTTLAEVLKHPRAEAILERYRIPCLHCPMAAFEMGNLRIGDITKAYGIDLRGLLRELNQPSGRKGGKPRK